MKLRYAKHADIRQLINLYRRRPEIKSWEGEPFNRAYFKATLDDHEMRIVVCEKDGKILGAGEMEFDYNLNYLTVPYIVVREEHAGKGIGTRIMDRIISISKKKNMRYVMLEVFDWNKRMKRFMKKHRFRKRDRVELYVKKL